MTRKAILVCMVLIFAAGTAVSADTPEADEIIDKMIAAVGGDGLDKLEVIRLEVAEEKTHNDGNFSKNSYVAYVDMSAIDTMRLEMDGGVVLGRNGGQSWATNKGVVDDRPQTPYMAKGTLNQTLFPLLLPYSLRMEGVWVKEVGEITWRRP